MESKIGVIEIKILHICQYYNDGWGYQENLLPRYQAKLGHEVVVVTSDRRPYYAGDSNPRIIGTGTFYDNGIRVERLPIKWEFKNRFVVFKDLMNSLEREKPDYVFHHGLTMPSLIIASKYKKNYPHTFLAADNHADLNNSAKNPLWRLGYYRLFWTNMLRLNVKYLDLIFGVTPARCYFAENELGIPHDIVRLLPIGADEIEANKYAKNKTTNISSKGRSKLIVISGGKWYKGKGLKQLVDAIKNSDVELNIFGTSEDDYTEKLINNLPRNANFLGWKNRNEILELLTKADIAIWPVSHTTLIEDAIATKTPLILRYSGNTLHFIKGNGAYLFTKESNEIRQLFELFSRSADLLKDMKEKSEKMLDLLSYKRVAKESIDYYYDKKPKLTHKIFMNYPLYNQENIDFHKLSER